MLQRSNLKSYKSVVHNGANYLGLAKALNFMEVFIKS